MLKVVKKGKIWFILSCKSDILVEVGIKLFFELLVLDFSIKK